MIKTSLIGMYNYDNSLFDDLTFPAGIDKDIFIDSLLLKYGEKPTLHSSVDFMKTSISIWGQKWYNSFLRIYTAIMTEYDPLYNFNRHEEYSDTENRNTTGNDTRNVTSQNSSETSSTTDSNNTAENKVSAFNAETYQPDSQNTTNSGINSEGSDSSSGSETQTGSTSENENRTLEHTAHLYGNIGVTKSQEMLTDEIEVRLKYNLYDVICDKFSDELLLYLY